MVNAISRFQVFRDNSEQHGCGDNQRCLFGRRLGGEQMELKENNRKKYRLMSRIKDEFHIVVNGRCRNP
jgi:hypothetical protein